MKRVTASEALENSFGLLDEVVRGEPVHVDYAGKRLVIARNAAKWPSKGTRWLPGHDALLSAWSEFTRSGDPKLSFCDVSSFAVMREHGIRQVVTLDGLFREAGFDALPDTPGR